MARASRTESKIPEFASLEEEADFWDTHSLADFEDEFEPVGIQVAHPLRHGIVVTLESEEFHRLNALAKERGVSMFDLARTWIVEALARSSGGRTSAGGR